MLKRNTQNKLPNYLGTKHPNTIPKYLGTHNSYTSPKCTGTLHQIDDQNIVERITHIYG